MRPITCRAPQLITFPRFTLKLDDATMRRDRQHFAVRLVGPQRNPMLGWVRKSTTGNRWAFVRREQRLRGERASYVFTTRRAAAQALHATHQAERFTNIS